VQEKLAKEGKWGYLDSAENQNEATGVVKRGGLVGMGFGEF